MGKYKNELIKNLDMFYPALEADEWMGQIRISTENQLSQSENRAWIYDMLEKLPEINEAVERVMIVTESANVLLHPVVINPKDADLNGLAMALEKPFNGLGNVK